MRRKIFIRSVIGIMVTLMLSLQTYIPAYSQSPFLTTKALAEKTAKGIFRQIVGDSHHGAIWKSWGYKLSNDNGTIATVGRIFYRPFASSKNICRTYETVIQTPSPLATRASSRRTPNKSYEIHSFLYMARRLKEADCRSLKSSQYFRINMGVTDEEVERLIDDLNLVLKDWYSIKSHNSGGSMGHKLSLSDLSLITISKDMGKGFATFELRIRGEKGVARGFKVQIPVTGVPHYKVYLSMP